MQESHQRPAIAASTYTSHRKHLEDFRLKSATHYDRVLLMLSGGALAASLTVLPDLAETQNVIGKGLLILAWVTLTGTILCVGLSYFAAAQSARKDIDKLDTTAMHNSLMGQDQDAEWFQPTNCWQTIIPWLNSVGGILFVIGLALMVIFASVNF